MNFSDWYTDRADVYRIVDQSDGGITRSVRVLVSAGVPCRIYQSGKPALTMRDTAAAVTGSDKLMCGLSADIRKGDELRITRPGGAPEGYFAGKLIMDAGLRGYRVGDAQVSEKHCGFVINRKNASAQEVRQLMQDVQDKVKAQFGVMLEPEVKMLGEF